MEASEIDKRDYYNEGIGSSTKAPDMAIGQEVMLAIEKQLGMLEQNISQLAAKLSPVLNYTDDHKSPDSETPKGMYSPMVNMLMTYSDMLSTYNRMLRDMGRAVEI